MLTKKPLHIHTKFWPFPPLSKMLENRRNHSLFEEWWVHASAFDSIVVASDNNEDVDRIDPTSAYIDMNPREALNPRTAWHMQDVNRRKGWFCKWKICTNPKVNRGLWSHEKQALEENGDFRGQWWPFTWGKLGTEQQAPHLRKDPQCPDLAQKLQRHNFEKMSRPQTMCISYSDLHGPKIQGHRGPFQ